ncbi:hypothetical protein CLOM_g5168 [Closterium sp. NIES-68]|nr:hypothetical protein CLOM_g5168 [Closterium sp. NIES-68]GJP82944.1 hypothetical protein CLOP_g13163 [Closterium sp. NIES-67]
MGSALGKQFKGAKGAKRSKGSTRKASSKQLTQVDTGQQRSLTPLSASSLSASSVNSTAAVGGGTPSRPHACRPFSLDELEQATGGWAAERRIGAGRCGDVYTGTPGGEGGAVWAVKRARGAEWRSEEFQKAVKQIGTKHHLQLVRLVGFCSDVNPATHTQEHILVYELMAHGDLTLWIGPRAQMQLTLQQRLDVLIGVAQALQYLHAFSLVHARIHPGNVLLDGNMHARVSDFGLPAAHTQAEMGRGGKGGQEALGRGKDEEGRREGGEEGRKRDSGVLGNAREGGVDGRDGGEWHRSNISGGSSSSIGGGGVGGVESAGVSWSGYVDPEFLQTHRLMPAVDVYSFGVLALMLLTARKAAGTTSTHRPGDSDGDGTTGMHKHKDKHADQRTSLIHWVTSLLPTKNPAAFTDPHLLSPSSPANPALLLRLATLALSCTALPSSARPSVNRLLLELTEMKEEFFGLARNAVLERVDREVAEMRGGNFLEEMARAESFASKATHSEGEGGGVSAKLSVGGSVAVSGSVGEYAAGFGRS